MNILHTRAAAVGFTFRVDGIERYAQCFAAIVGIQGKFFVVLTVTVARGVAVAQFAVGAHTEFFVFAEALTQVERTLSAVVAEPAQTDFAVAFIGGFFGFDIDGTGYRIKLITAEIQAGQRVAFAAELPNGSVFFRYGIHQSTRFGVVEGLFVVVDDGNRCGKGVGFTQYAQVHAVAQVAVAGNGVRTGSFNALGISTDMNLSEFALLRNIVGGR